MNEKYRGEIMLQMGKYKEAIECYEKALKLPDSPKSDVYYNIGNWLCFLFKWIKCQGCNKT